MYRLAKFFTTNFSRAYLPYCFRDWFFQQIVAVNFCWLDLMVFWVFFRKLLKSKLFPVAFLETTGFNVDQLSNWLHLVNIHLLEPCKFFLSILGVLHFDLFSIFIWKRNKTAFCGKKWLSQWLLDILGLSRADKKICDSITLWGMALF